VVAGLARVDAGLGAVVGDVGDVVGVVVTGADVEVGTMGAMGL
jgi:hypothetical protein